MMHMFKASNGSTYGLIKGDDGWYIHTPYCGCRHRLDKAPAKLYPANIIQEAQRFISDKEKLLNQFNQGKY